MALGSTKSTSRVTSSSNGELVTPKKSRTTKLTSLAYSQTSSDVKLSEVTSVLISSTETDINLEKVEQIKQAIRDGSLEINATKIAKGLLNYTIESITADIVTEDE